MKVHGSANPGVFSVDEIPNKPGWCLCRFYENAHETNCGWKYDEYHLELYGAKSSLDVDIANNYDVYFLAAKASERPSEAERLSAVEAATLALMMGG